MLGAEPSTSYGLNLFGYNLTIWNEILILAIFGTIVILLAVWSFGVQELSA
jgi:hypothetical protein